jgi:uncharacterized protein
MATVHATAPTERQDAPPSAPVPRWLMPAWAGFVLVALLGLAVLPLVAWAVAAPSAAAALLAATARRSSALSWLHRRADRLDLVALAGLYLAVVGSFRLAFTGFTTDRAAGLFLTFAGGLLLGVAGPVVYTTWIRQRPLRTLGLGTHQLRTTLQLAVVFGGVQFTIMFWGYALPATVDWVPLLVMSLTVGLFEAIFFRGFVQGRLEHSFGTVPGVVGAAALYALYHVGYGMPSSEMAFLFGLGVVYAIAYRLVDNIFVLWPLLTPIGAFFNNLEGGDIALPWASIAGFGNVLAVMAVVIWLASRHQRRTSTMPP